MKVVYGHTDSIYVEIDSIEKSKETLSILNEHVRKSFPNVLGLDEHPVVLEFEKYFHSLGVGVTKNRNAGLITWKDNKNLEEMEFTMTGFTAKRVSETKLAKEVQLTVLRMWVEGKTEDEVSDYLNDIYYKVLNGKIPLLDILKRSRYREARFLVTCQTCKKNSTLNDLVSATCCSLPKLKTLEDKNVTVGAGIAGILFYNNLPNNIPITDSYLYCKIKENSNNKFIHPVTQQGVVTTWYSANNEKEIESFLKTSGSFIDWFYYANTIVKKAEPIYLAMDWASNKISKDRNQKDLEEWF